MDLPTQLPWRASTPQAVSTAQRTRPVHPATPQEAVAAFPQATARNTTQYPSNLGHTCILHVRLRPPRCCRLRPLPTVRTWSPRTRARLPLPEAGAEGRRAGAEAGGRRGEGGARRGGCLGRSGLLMAAARGPGAK